jgi:hypothetical protein
LNGITVENANHWSNTGQPGVFDEWTLSRPLHPGIRGLPWLLGQWQQDEDMELVNSLAWQFSFGTRNQVAAQANEPTSLKLTFWPTKIILQSVCGLIDWTSKRDIGMRCWEGSVVIFRGRNPGKAY